MKAAFVSIIGRPSSGKSTLLNSLCGQKISIVSPVPQTTRAKVRGILNDDRGQLVFIDTPGFHDSKRKYNRRMIDLVAAALEETEVSLYVVDAARSPGAEEEGIARMLAETRNPIVVAINKIDLPSAKRNPARTFVESVLPAARPVEISATVGTGLDVLKTTLFAVAPDGELMYPADYYTDQPPEFRVSELIREKAILHTHHEVPHALYVEVSEMDVRKSRAGKTLWIRAFLMVERESQKGIVVGRGGEKIRAIRIAAQEEIEALFPYDSVYLDLRVKVNPNWRSNDAVLRRIGGE